MSGIEIKSAERLSGCEGRHYVIVGEVIDLYVMPSPKRISERFTIFAYEDRECFYVGKVQRSHTQSISQFIRDHYGKAARWQMAA